VQFLHRRDDISEMLHDIEGVDALDAIVLERPNVQVVDDVGL
jgi:hypothetical protein